MQTQFIYIDIDDSALAGETSGLLSVLERQFRVKFQVRGQIGGDALRGRICNGVVADAPQGLPPGCPTLVVPSATRRSGDNSLCCTSIRFADDPEVPWPYRGRMIAVRAKLDPGMYPTHALPGGRILASDGEGRPVWVLAERQVTRTHCTSLRLPRTPLGEDVGLAAAEERFIQVLPLFHFLREVVGPQGHSNPLPRAAFIIDDPNLHWPSYGFVDYRAIAASARRERYHVAFATIPLDAWWVHGKTAEIFRAHADGLSLLIHGNNHARQELAQTYSSEAIAALLQQTVARIRRLEAKSGLAVSRVMVPPHGACSARMLAELPCQGFESACISAGSLRAHNEGREWTKGLGMAPGEVVEGCPVLPRWAFSSVSDATLLAAAYLGQPLILRGHHQDLKGGLDLLCSLARKINALGDFRWGNLAELSRKSYRHRIEGSTMHIQPLTTRIEVDVPDGVDELRIEHQALDWRPLQSQTKLDIAPGCSVVSGVRGGYTYEFEHRLSAPAVVRPRATSTKLLLRRIFTEARDRLRFFS